MHCFDWDEYIVLTHKPHTHTITILEVTKIEGPRESVTKKMKLGGFKLCPVQYIERFYNGGF